MTSIGLGLPVSHRLPGDCLTGAQPNGQKTLANTHDSSNDVVAGPPPLADLNHANFRAGPQQPASGF